MKMVRWTAVASGEEVGAGLRSSLPPNKANPLLQRLWQKDDGSRDLKEAVEFLPAKMDCACALLPGDDDRTDARRVLVSRATEYQGSPAI